MTKTNRRRDAIVDAFLGAGRNSKQKAEPAVVKADHPEILCNDRPRVVDQLAAGFDVLLEETTSALEAQAARGT
jgi:hypothetical protein